MGSEAADIVAIAAFLLLPRLIADLWRQGSDASTYARLAMRAANIITAIATAIWFGMFLIGRGLMHAAIQRHPWPGNAVQMDYYVLVPVWILLALLFCAWASNAMRRWYGLAGFISGAAMVALLPYLLFYTGGM